MYLKKEYWFLVAWQSVVAFVYRYRDQTRIRDIDDGRYLLSYKKVEGFFSVIPSSRESIVCCRLFV